MNRLLLFCASLFVALQLNAQQFDFAPQQTYTYVYRLDSAQASFAFKKNVFDTPWFFNNKVDSFLQVSPRLEPGVYILARYVEPHLGYQILTVPLGKIQVNAFNGIVQVRLFDSSYNHLPNVSFWVNQKLMELDTLCDCYNLDRKSKVRDFFIKKDQSIMLGKIEGDYKTYPTPPPVSYGGTPAISHGYFIVNQPKYHSGDSVKLKAYILNGNGVPFTKPLKLFLIPGYQPYKKVFMGYVKPETKGAYVHQFKLADTLKIDRNYTLHFEEKNGASLMSCNFNIEDYKLRNSTYSAEIEKAKVYKGEKIKFRLNAKDANDLPLTDARVRLRIKMLSFHNFTGKILFVPHIWREKMYETFVEMDISNATEIIIPSNALPALDMQLRAEISFSNAAGELQKREINFEVTQQSDYYSFTYEEGTLQALFISNGEMPKVKAILKGYLYNELIRLDTIQLPSTHFIDPNCEKYQLLDSLGKEIQWLFLPHMPQPIFVEGKRTHDSIFISAYNPGNFPFYYRIYRDDKLILVGKDRNFNYRKVDTSGTSYNIIYTYIYRGVSTMQESVYTFKERELNVKTNLPLEIYPGQTLAVDLKVLNSNRNPQANVNLTAFGINSQFEGMYTPSLPYFGEEKDRIYLQERTRLDVWPFPNQYLSINYISYTTLLKAGIVYMGDYRLRYPNEILFVAKKKLPRAQSEFTPFVVANGKRVEVYYMEIDGKPNYVKGLNQPNYSFWISAGKHEIKLRTKSSLYTIPNLVFTDSFKYILSFDTLCLPAGITKQAMSSQLSFSKEEMEKIKSHLFMFLPKNFGLTYKDVYLVQDQKISGFLYPLTQHYSIEKRENEFAYGLFSHDSISFIVNGSLFQKVRFEPNSRYVYFRERIIREEIDSIELPYDFAFFKINDESFRTLYDTALRVIIPEPEVHDWAAAAKEKERSTVDELCYFNFRFEPKQSENELRSDVYFTGLRDVGVRNFILINQQDELQSIINPAYTLGQTELNLLLQHGTYDIYFTGENNRLGKILNQEIKPDGMLLIRLDSTDFVNSCQELEVLIPKAKRLQEIYHMRESMLVNYRPEDYVEVREKHSFQLSASDEKPPILSGFVFDKYGTALNEVIITLEQSGKVKGISFSDVTGGFLMKDLEPGNYQLRLTRYGSCVTIIQHVSLQRNKVHNLSIRLQECGFGSDGGNPAPTVYFGKSKISKSDYIKYSDTKEPLEKGTGMIKGKIVDANTKRALDYVSISIKKNGVNISSSLTDDEGEFVIKNLASGEYDLHASFVGYKNVIISQIQVNKDEIRFVNFSMEVSNNQNLQEVVVSYKRSLVDPGGVRGSTTSHKEVMALGTRSVNSIAGTSLGVESRSGGTPNFRGARADGTAYYIDGVRVNATAINTPMNAISNIEVVTLGVNQAFKEEQKSRLFAMANNQEVKENRDNFRDYAFWVPNLVTNKFGEAHVSITFPDNITRWRNFIMAMDEGLNTKVYTHDIKAYKPLSASLYIPSFALKGDKVFIKGKLANYTGEEFEITSAFQMKDSLLQEKTHLLKQGLVEKTLVQTENLDTLILSYKLNTKLNYADGEKYLLPVLPNGIEQNIITYYSLDKDTSFKFSTQEKGTYTLSITNNYTQLIRDEIQRLKDYHYGCVEQTTSKLNALLVEKSLCKLLGDSFQNEELIKTCIKRLEVMQQSNGAYGWFSRSGAEVWLTHYVLTTLFDARKMGYRSHAYSNGIAYLNKHFGEFNQSDKIKALQLLFAERIDVDYTGILSKIEETSLNFYDRLLITYVKQQMDLPHFSGFLFEGIQKDAEGGIYWNTPTLNIYQNRANAGLMAYEVLKRDQADSSILAGIRKYYFNEKTFGMGVYRNTLESAKVLQTMAKDIALSEKGTLFSRVKLNGKDLGTRFPMKLNLSNSASYSVEKTGAKARMFVNQKVFVEQPKQDTLLFKINTYFTQDNHQVDTLQTNYQINYVVNVSSLKNQEYVMVQIPIPASCNYLSKLNRFNADEIEYHKDRVILYFRKMRAGSYNFTFSLEPRFEGEFTLLPVQIENMYDPEVKGNNQSKVVWVGGK